MNARTLHCFDELEARYADFAHSLRQKLVYGNPLTVTQSSLGPEVEIRTNAGARRVDSFISLDYLGIGSHPEVIEAVQKNAALYGSGFASSRTVMDSLQHQRLEEALADFKRTDNCLLVNTGYGANVTLLKLLLGPTLVGGHRLKRRKKAEVFVDVNSHASIMEAILELRNADLAHGAGRMPSLQSNDQTQDRSQLGLHKYRHLDYAELEEGLHQARQKTSDCELFIVTDSLFSMNGDFVDAKRLLALGKAYEARIVLDNAHSDTTYGHQGRGWLEVNGITSPEDQRYFFQAGTMSKGFAGLGGYVTTFPALAELARVSQWEYIFSVGLPTFLVATYLTTLELVMGEDGETRRKQLAHNSAFLRRKLTDEGFNTLKSVSHIIPVVVGEGGKCLEAQAELATEHGLLIGAIRYPAVAKNEALLRVAVNAMHSEEQLMHLVDGLKKVRSKYGF